MHWARSVDGDVLQRLYALYVGPRRLLERGGPAAADAALAPLPPTERALALERCRDCNAPLDTALTAELAAALATVEDALASGDLAPGFPSLADAFVFPIVECASACGAAPLSGSVLSPPRPATLAWRASLLEREAFAEVAGEIGRLWGVE
jgi:glutathione S-transferase